MKSIAISIIAVGFLIGAAFFFSGNKNQTGTEYVPENNVSIVEGVQIVEIRAKGGYQPRRSSAKAAIPTILRFNTAGTFDCSSAVRIPSLKISKILPPNGSTDIDIGSVSAGILSGSCGMGMYRFEITFES
jgi:plastocyanin domain-containing protein